MNKKDLLVLVDRLEIRHPKIARKVIKEYILLEKENFQGLTEEEVRIARGNNFIAEILDEHYIKNAKVTPRGLKGKKEKEIFLRIYYNKIKLGYKHIKMNEFAEYCQCAAPNVSKWVKRFKDKKIFFEYNIPFRKKKVQDKSRKVFEIIVPLEEAKEMVRIIEAQN